MILSGVVAEERVIVFISVRADPSSYPNTLTDSKGNTWHALSPNTGLQGGQFFYAYNAIVGTGHTFSLTSTNWQSSAICVSAWSGIRSASDPFEAGTNNLHGGASSPYSGVTETPASIGDLIVFGLAGEVTTPVTINSGFAILDTASGIGGASPEIGALAYLIAASTASVTPTLTSGGGVADLNAAVFAKA